MFQIEIDKNVLELFPEDKQLLYQKKIFDKVEDNLAHQFYRIKPIKNARGLSVYELKITLEKKHYRLAFSIKKVRYGFFISARRSKNSYLIRKLSNG